MGTKSFQCFQSGKIWPNAQNCRFFCAAHWSSRRYIYPTCHEVHADYFLHHTSWTKFMGSRFLVEFLYLELGMAVPNYLWKKLQWVCTGTPLKRNERTWNFLHQKCSFCSNVSFISLFSHQKRWAGSQLYHLDYQYFKKFGRFIFITTFSLMYSPFYFGK